MDSEILDKELKNLPDGFIVLIETSAERALEVSSNAVKSILSNKRYTLIVVSASRPYPNLIDIYQKNKIDTKRIFCIDCASKGSSPKGENKAIYVEGASALTKISISIDELSKAIAGNKLLFIDSITTMLIYNEPHVFARFIHSVLTKLRMAEISCLLISLENETNREVRAEIAQLCDKVIKT